RRLFLLDFSRKPAFKKSITRPLHIFHFSRPFFSFILCCVLFFNIVIPLFGGWSICGVEGSHVPLIHLSPSSSSPRQWLAVLLPARINQLLKVSSGIDSN